LPLAAVPFFLVVLRCLPPKPDLPQSRIHW
jgi:hypothetical protein